VAGRPDGGSSGRVGRDKIPTGHGYSLNLYKKGTAVQGSYRLKLTVRSTTLGSNWGVPASNLPIMRADEIATTIPSLREARELSRQRNPRARRGAKELPRHRLASASLRAETS
jgi:hypothetical protein